MPADPPENFNPILMQHQANVALRGGFEHSWEASERLEAEAEAQAALIPPGGGVRWHRITDPRAPDESTDPRARLRALGLSPRATRNTQEPS